MHRKRMVVSLSKPTAPPLSQAVINPPRAPTVITSSSIQPCPVVEDTVCKVDAVCNVQTQNSSILDAMGFSDEEDLDGDHGMNDTLLVEPERTVKSEMLPKDNGVAPQEKFTRSDNAPITSGRKEKLSRGYASQSHRRRKHSRSHKRSRKKRRNCRSRTPSKSRSRTRSTSQSKSQSKSRSQSPANSRSPSRDTYKNSSLIFSPDFERFRSSITSLMKQELISKNPVTKLPVITTRVVKKRQSIEHRPSQHKVRHIVVKREQQLPKSSRHTLILLSQNCRIRMEEYHGCRVFHYQHLFDHAFVQIAREGLVNDWELRKALIDTMLQLKDEDALYRNIRSWMLSSTTDDSMNSSAMIVTGVSEKYSESSIDKLVRLGGYYLSQSPTGDAFAQLLCEEPRFQWPVSKISYANRPVSLVQNTMPFSQKVLSPHAGTARVFTQCIHVLLVPNYKQDVLAGYLRVFGDRGFYFYDMLYPFEQAARTLLSNENDVTQDSFNYFVEELQRGVETTFRQKTNGQEFVLERFWHWYEYQMTKIGAAIPVVIFNLDANKDDIITMLQHDSVYVTKFVDDEFLSHLTCDYQFQTIDDLADIASHTRYDHQKE